MPLNKPRAPAFLLQTKAFHADLQLSAVLEPLATRVQVR